MGNEPTEKPHGSAIVHSIRATPAPLWLLQKDDTGTLYLSFLISTLVHVILFFIMVATRIFHPFAGISKQFDLVWLSPVSVQGTSEPMKAEEPAPARKNPLKIPAPSKNSPMTEPVAEKTPKPAPAPRIEPAKPAEVPKEVTQTAPEMSRVDEEMVITRYGGKIAEILERKTDVPLFRTFSSVKLKSSGGKADVRDIVEKKVPPPAPVRVVKADEPDRLKQAAANVEKAKLATADRIPSPVIASATPPLQRFRPDTSRERIPLPRPHTFRFDVQQASPKPERRKSSRA